MSDVFTSYVVVGAAVVGASAKVVDTVHKFLSQPKPKIATVTIGYNAPRGIERCPMGMPYNFAARVYNKSKHTAFACKAFATKVEQFLGGQWVCTMEEMFPMRWETVNGCYEADIDKGTHKDFLFAQTVSMPNELSSPYRVSLLVTGEHVHTATTTAKIVTPSVIVPGTHQGLYT